MEIAKNYVRSILNMTRIQLGMDKVSENIEQYEGYAKNCEVQEQIDGCFAKHKELKPILNQQLEEFISNINKHCDLNHPKTILDFGVGTGRYLQLFDQEKHELIGIDANLTVLEKFTAKSIPKAKLMVLDFIAKEAKSHPFFKEYQHKIDVIYSTAVIQLLQRSKIDVLFKTFADLQKKEGLFFITFPAPNNWLDIYKRRRYQRFRPKTIEKLLENNGYTILDSKSSIHGERLTDYQSPMNNYGYIVVAKKTA